jgi:hypothetical protein
MRDADRLARALREQYPLPSPPATERARAAVRQAAGGESREPGRRPRLRRLRRRRPILIVAGVTIALVAAGVAIGVSLLDVTPPRFSSASGWHVGSTPTHSCDVGMTRGRCVMAEAWASTVPYRDCPNCVPPHETLATLPPDGIIIQLTDARERPPYGRPGDWPTQSHASQVIRGPFEGEPGRDFSYVQLVVRTPDDVEHFLFIWFGRPHPTAQQLARANAELRTVRP